jgi:lipocalin
MKSTAESLNFASATNTSSWGNLPYVGALMVSLACAAGCAADPPAPDVVTAPKDFDASSLEGAWYVVATDLPEWTVGEKKSPMVHFKLHDADGDGILKMENKVTFLEGGKPGEHLGDDTQDAVTRTNFTWRSSGALSTSSANWYVVYMSPEKTWAVSYYDKRGDQPAGVTVISRTPAISDAVLAEARTLINGQAALAAHADGLKVIDHTDTPKTAVAD